MSEQPAEKKIKLDEESSEKHVSYDDIDYGVPPDYIRPHSRFVLLGPHNKHFHKFYIKPKKLSESESSLLQFILEYEHDLKISGLDWGAFFIDLIRPGILSNSGYCDKEKAEKSKLILETVEDVYRDNMRIQDIHYQVPWTKQEFKQLCTKIVTESADGGWIETHDAMKANLVSVSGTLFIFME